MDESQVNTAQKQDLTAIKAAMSQTIMNLYNQFIHAIKPYPGQPFQQQQAYIRFDEGHMWLQQALGNAEFEIHVPTQDSVPTDSIPASEPVPCDTTPEQPEAA